MECYLPSVRTDVSPVQGQAQYPYYYYYNHQEEEEQVNHYHYGDYPANTGTRSSSSIAGNSIFNYTNDEKAGYVTPPPQSEDIRTSPNDSQLYSPPPNTKPRTQSYSPLSFNTPYHARLSYTSTHFEYLQQVGQGQFGQVYKARLKSSGDEPTYYCIKQIEKRRIRNDTKLKREIAIHSRISHPHVVTMFGYFQDHDTVNLVMEACLFGDLFRIFQQETLHNLFNNKRTRSSYHRGVSHEEAAMYVSQIADALKYLHSHHIYHRDIKPENILVVAESPPFSSSSHHHDRQYPPGYYKHLKLCDFGYAIYAPSSNTDSTTSSSGSSSFGSESIWRRSLCGTPEYVPPEMVNYTPIQNKQQGEAFNYHHHHHHHGGKIKKPTSCTYDVRYVDMWELGILAYELVIGETPTYLPLCDRNQIAYEMGYCDINEPTYDIIRDVIDYVHVDVMRLKREYTHDHNNNDYDHDCRGFNNDFVAPVVVDQEYLLHNFIACLTQRIPSKRITMDAVLNHEWIVYNLRNL